VGYRQDGSRAQNAECHFEQTAAEHDEEDKFLAGREVGFPDHGQGDGHEVKVGDGVHDHDEDGLQRRNGRFAAILWLSDESKRVGGGLTAGVGVDLPLVVEGDALEEGDEEAGDVCHRHHDVRSFDQ
jgi:hypothetical protein